MRTVLFQKKDPIIGTIILTDVCNLKCRHCAVGNIEKVMYPYDDIHEEMVNFYEDGIRLLFFSGGEPLLWKDKGKTIFDLISEARRMGFFIINVATNGTVTLDIPEADLIFLSIDGTRETHNLIRGNTFDTIWENIEKAHRSNICIYMEINQLNYGELRQVGKIAQENPHIKCISFNFHTPYYGTEELALDNGQKKVAVSSIKRLMDQGFPVLNLRHTLDLYLRNKWDKPCFQCTVSANKVRYRCGRCIEEAGLCEKCGYLFAVELTEIFKGNLRVIAEMLKTYPKFI